MLTEAWLLAAWRHQTLYIEECLRARLSKDEVDQYPRPVRYQVAVGHWPGDGEQPLGFCHPAEDCSDDRTYTVFVSPLLAGDHRRTTTLLATLLHEQLHAWTGVNRGHDKKFQRAAVACGLRPPHRVVAADQISLGLRKELHRLAKRLGPCQWKKMRRT